LGIFQISSISLLGLQKMKIIPGDLFFEVQGEMILDIFEEFPKIEK